MPLISNIDSKLFKSAEESEKPERAEIIGDPLPSWVHGTYLRVGPGLFDLKGDADDDCATPFTFRHWLDGYALLQKFEITGNSINFEKRYLESDAYKRGVAAHRPLVNEFATPGQRDPNKGFFSRIVSTLLPEFTDNNYSTVFQIGSDLFVSCDTCFFRRFDGHNLDSYDKYDGNKLFGLNGQSAHPLTDKHGDVYNVGFSMFPSSKYSFIKMPSGTNSKDMLKKAKTVATFSSRWTGALSINHSFGMTDNYLIYVEQPVVVSMSKVAGTILKGDTLKDILEWRGPEETNRFIVVEKSTGKVLKTEFYSSQAFYFMHIINSYEEDGKIVMDIGTYESPNMLDSLFLEKLRSNESSESVDMCCIQRFTIPILHDFKSLEDGKELLPSPNKCSAIKTGNRIVLGGLSLTERGLEMPVVNRKVFGKKHGFVYSAGTFNRSCFSNCLLKTDVEKGETVVWKGGDDLYPGEPCFIPNPEGNEEEDGIIVSALTDTGSDKEDYILFIDPKTMTEISRAKFKSHIPSALHGFFLPAKK